MSTTTRGFEIVIGGGVWGPQLYSVWTTVDGKCVSNIGVFTSYLAARATVQKLAGLPLTFDAAGQPAEATATPDSELLLAQRRYQFLRDSGWVTLYERVDLDGGATVIYPGRIGGSVVDEVCDAALTADGGGV